ncbi:MAG: HAD-IIIC family phosphatase, partial [Candidatus Omnitrophica bacterium]|nr:HAD-IIIC family phosphatase [Candidatus Omnitrophota bacterium]
MITDLHEMKYSQILMKNSEFKQNLTGEAYGITVLSNIVTSQLNDILEYALRSQGINAQVRSGDYDNILQDAAKFPDSKLLIIFWELSNILDGMPHKFEVMNEATRAELTGKIKSELAFFFQTISGRSQVILNTFSARAFTHRFPYQSPLDNLATELNKFLRQNVPVNTVLIDLDKILARVSIDRAIDYRYYYSSKALYSIDFYKDYSVTVAPYILAPLGKSKKAVILDCDNTLWKGILGEDGPQGIDMSPESNEGGIFQEVQSLLLSLHAQGILLGLCSKNNSEEVDQVLREHPDMLIK